MRVIVVLPAAPHPFGDTAARWFYVLLKDLLARQFDVRCLVISSEAPERLTQAQALLSEAGTPGRLQISHFEQRTSVGTVRRKLRSVLRPFSETATADGVREALDRHMAAGYDILHLEQLWTGWLGLDVPRSLLNIHHFEIIDWEDRRNLSVAERKAHWQMTRATMHIVRHTSNMRMFTPRLTERAREINPAANYWTVPFALDPGNYPEQPFVEDPVVGLFGSMHWHPSRSAGVRLLRDLWPRIKAQVPRAKLLVAGWNARRYLAQHGAGPDIELIENLPKPTDFFSRAAVMLYAPSRGSGFKVKVLESMAYGVPVVTTWEGAEGIQYTQGEELFVEENDEALVARAVTLLRDAALRRRMRAAARALVFDCYSPQPVMRSLLRVYEHMAESGSVASHAAARSTP